MEGFILRITAYHGEPLLVGTVPVRAGVSHDFPIPKDQIINDPNNATVIETTDEGAVESTYALDELINDFQDEYGCKISYSPDEPNFVDGMPVIEFDMFEPAWPEQEEAVDVIEDLTERLKDWITGHPAGR